MRPNIWRTIAGGFVGTFFMTLLMRFVAPMMGVQMNIAASLAKMMHTSVAMGLLAHFMLGTIVFPLIYVYLLYRVLPGAPAVRGIEWGAILWFLMELFVMPMLGMGIFNSVMGGGKTVMAALIAHVVYGAFLGWVADGHLPRRLCYPHFVVESGPVCRLTLDYTLECRLQWGRQAMQIGSEIRFGIL